LGNVPPPFFPAPGVVEGEADDLTLEVGLDLEGAPGAVNRVGRRKGSLTVYCQRKAESDATAWIIHFEFINRREVFLFAMSETRLKWQL
jgi:hypothetical protein